MGCWCTGEDKSDALSASMKLTIAIGPVRLCLRGLICRTHQLMHDGALEHFLASRARRASLRA